MIKLSLKLMVLLTLLSTSGCVSTPVISGWVKPICISKDDVLTLGTKQQILAHDETLGKPCK